MKTVKVTITSQVPNTEDERELHTWLTELLDDVMVEVREMNDMGAFYDDDGDVTGQWDVEVTDA